MNLKQFASPLKAKNHFVKASFGGFQGSGKSRTATEFIIGSYKQLGCKKPLLLIDNEKGSRFLKPILEKSGIETLVKDTIELADVLDAFKFLNAGEIDYLFIDSLTKVWYKYIRDYKATFQNKKFMTLQDWGKILPAWQEVFSDPFVQLEGNCVFTGRGGNQYEMEEIEQESGKVKKEFVKSGVKMKMAGETPYEPDLNIWMEISQEVTKSGLKVWRTAHVMKDRSATIDGDIINENGEKEGPDYEDFKPVVDFLTEQETGEVKGSTNTTNLAPKEDWDDRKKRREIALDEIKTLFESLGLGTGANDKQIKALLAESIWDTTSWEKLTVLRIEELEEGSLLLKVIRRFTDQGVVLHKDTIEDLVIEAKKELDPITDIMGAEEELPEPESVEK